MSWSREDMARRAAREIPDGPIVNLGIGLPTQVAELPPRRRRRRLHSENGLLGMGPFPFESEATPKLINAGKQTVTALPGAATFDSALSFAMIRGGHVDLAILGAMQVAVQRRPRELGRARQADHGHRRRDGSRRRRAPRGDDAEPRVQGRQAQARRSADATR